MVGVFAAIAGAAACRRSQPAPPPAPVVGVVTAQAADLPVTRNYPGRLAATLTAQVRPRITGNVLERVYKEGTDVKAGDVLFRIDPAPLQATLRAQIGVLSQAEVSAHIAELQANRSNQLGASDLLAQRDVDNAAAAAAETTAAVKSARANVENARINLGYATVTAPIAGRAGRAGVTQGALVSPTDLAPLTTVQVIDPIYANFSEPMAEIEQLRQAQASGGLKPLAPDHAQVQIVLPDGRVYPHPGSLDFADLAVDPATGAVDLRAVLPNSDRTLLPGMFVTVRLTLAALHQVFLLPQIAIQRDSDGAFVYVVGSDDKVAQKRVTVGEQQGPNWVVEGGLAQGDRVIASGIQKARPGSQVKSEPYVPAPAAASSAAKD